MRHIVQKLQYFYGLLSGTNPPPPPYEGVLLLTDGSNFLLTDNSEFDLAGD